MSIIRKPSLKAQYFRSSHSSWLGYTVAWLNKDCLYWTAWEKERATAGRKWRKRLLDQLFFSFFLSLFSSRTWITVHTVHTHIHTTKWSSENGAPHFLLLLVSVSFRPPTWFSDHQAKEKAHVIQVKTCCGTQSKTVFPMRTLSFTSIVKEGGKCRPCHTTKRYWFPFFLPSVFLGSYSLFRRNCSSPTLPN